MSIKQSILDDMKAALKSGDKQRLGVLRMLKAKITDAEVELRAEKGLDYQLDDEAAIQVLTRYAKQRRDSIESFKEVGREDAAAAEEAELAVVQEYLPRQLGPEEVRRIVKETVAEVGATSKRDLGKVMKAVMPKIKGAADGKVVNQLVRELLED
jgi:uncharacterized protein YqeY